MGGGTVTRLTFLYLSLVSKDYILKGGQNMNGFKECLLMLSFILSKRRLCTTRMIIPFFYETFWPILNTVRTLYFFRLDD